ncbi:hypothetical protein Tco_0968261 [Tanacetum coccineum]
MENMTGSQNKEGHERNPFSTSAPRNRQPRQQVKTTSTRILRLTTKSASQSAPSMGCYAALQSLLKDQQTSEFAIDVPKMEQAEEETNIF